jgi:hypothetical protein
MQDGRLLSGGTQEIALPKARALRRPPTRRPAHAEASVGYPDAGMIRRLPCSTISLRLRSLGMTEVYDSDNNIDITMRCTRRASQTRQRMIRRS